MKTLETYYFRHRKAILKKQKLIRKEKRKLGLEEYTKRKTIEKARYYAKEYVKSRYMEENNIPIEDNNLTVSIYHFIGTKESALTLKEAINSIDIPMNRCYLIEN